MEKYVKTDLIDFNNDLSILIIMCIMIYVVICTGISKNLRPKTDYLLLKCLPWFKIAILSIITSYKMNNIELNHLHDLLSWFKSSWSTCVVKISKYIHKSFQSTP